MPTYYEPIANCTNCGHEMILRPCRSTAGWYAGFTCTQCGCPHDRVSDYFKEDTEAQMWIDTHGLPVKSYWER